MYETVNLHVVLGKKRVMTCWDLDHRMDGTRTRFVTREFIGDETMFFVSAPSSIPSMGRVFDDLSFKKSYRTFTTDVTIRISTWTRTKHSRLYWRIRSLSFGDCENSCMARDALEHAG